MARLPRLVVPHYPHYVIQRSVDALTVFRDADDCRAFLVWLKEAAKLFQVAIHAYALLPGRVDLLATPADAVGLARMMQWVGRHYVPYFNQKYQRAGTLWQGRYRASVIEPQDFLLLCSRHIEDLPVRLGQSAQPGEYPWTSWAHHVGIQTDPHITDHALYWALGNTPFEREAAYRQRYEQGISRPQAEQLEAAAASGWPLGSESFKAGLARESGRRTQPGRRGRPVSKGMPGREQA